MDTIAAIATPPGEGGVAIIRISGREAFSIAAQAFSGPLHRYESHTAHVGKILSQSGAVIDEVLLLIMYAPRSYTGEDTVEIHCHGGGLISKRVLERIVALGARIAHPGEFTYRAFLNQKLDLAQAEAVQQLISAKNDLALKAATEQLSGALSKYVSTIQMELTDCAAILEAWVDFPEEGLEFATAEEMIFSLRKTQVKLEQLISSFEEGKLLQEGLTLCLAGPPNAGKSSLMNALLGTERAIVTEIPGTTRDILEETLRLGEIHIRLIDTAGIRPTQELIEQEGIRRSYLAMQHADLILLVLDSSRPTSKEEQVFLESVPIEKSLLILNKIDLPLGIEPLAFSDPILISAIEQSGLKELKDRIAKKIWQKGYLANDQVVLTSCRHKEAALEASQGVKRVIEGLQEGISAEFVSSDMRDALKALSRIIGKDISEEILNTVFSKFCVGK